MDSHHAPIHETSSPRKTADLVAGLTASAVVLPKAMAYHRGWTAGRRRPLYGVHPHAALCHAWWLPGAERQLHQHLGHTGRHRAGTGSPERRSAAAADRYRHPGEHGEYDIFSYGADGQPGGDATNADITNW